MTDRGQELPFAYSVEGKRVVDGFPHLDGILNQLALLIRESAKPRVNIAEITVRPHMDMEEPDWQGVVIDVEAQGDENAVRGWRESLITGHQLFLSKLEPNDKKLLNERVGIQIRTQFQGQS